MREAVTPLAGETRQPPPGGAAAAPRRTPARARADFLRDDGPIRKTYETQVREEFMPSSFQAEDEVLHFRSAEMSEASRMVLMRKMAKLAADFNELAELDRHLPNRDKRSVALMMTCRPWVWSMFDGLRKR